MAFKNASALYCACLSASALASPFSTTGIPSVPNQTTLGVSLGLAIPAGHATLSGSGTPVNFHHDLNRAINIGAQLRSRFEGPRPIGFELQTSYTHLTARHGAPSSFKGIDAFAIMANVYYRIMITNTMTPYLGVGVGYLSFSTPHPDQSLSNGTFGAQMIIGFAYPLTRHWQTALNYRVTTSVDNTQFKDFLNMNDTRLHTFNLELNYQF